MKILAISDLHGQLPQLNVEGIDLLLCAGDVCPDFRGLKQEAQHRWYDETFLPWWNQYALPKGFTWGNHDWIHTPEAYVDEEDTFTPDKLRVWFSPWSTRFMNWSYMENEKKLDGIYSDIPEGIDILVSHAPPFGYGDEAAPTGPWAGHLGGKSLLSHMLRVKPKVLICGHIHGGYGEYVHKHETGEVTRIFNVSIVDEGYKVVNHGTVIEV